LETPTLAQAVQECKTALIEAGVGESPALDARLLVQQAASVSQVQLILRSDQTMDGRQRSALEGLLQRRLGHEPMAYILGTKEFYGRSFKVDPRVLIPRPDTETLVETALSFARQAGRPLRIVDVCTGSGCVGITLAAQLGIETTLTDISPDALQVAGENAVALLSRPLPMLCGDLLSPTTGPYDLIVSNPPYLTRQWCEEVSPEVGHEPRLALDGLGADGLSAIRTLVRQSTSRIAKGGALMLECDYRQAREVCNLLADSGFTDVTVEQDLAGKDRVVWGIWQCTSN
jgi:release factor glutamine methyltransferase